MPLLGRQIKISGTDQVADSAALVGFFDAAPGFVQFFGERLGLVEDHSGFREHGEDGAIGSGDRGVELPARKDSGTRVARGLLDGFGCALDSLATQSGVDGAQQFFVDGRFG